MHAAFKVFLDLLYPKDPVEGNVERIEPPFCDQCGEPYQGAGSTEFVCTNCRGRKWHLSEARAGYYASGAVLDLIHEFKYRRSFHHLPEMGDWLLEGYDRYYAEQRWDWVIPVPLHRFRERQRMFNQSAELARWLSKRRGVPYLNALKRIKKTETQARLRRSERLRNQAGAFDLNVKPERMVEKRCLIIDDVFTTGATANACAKILRKAKASEVAVLTVARG
ncbi:MAG: ComF family protein [Verrucomicrobiota bacterium]